MKKIIKKSLIIQPLSLLFIFFTLALLIIASFLLEYYQSKGEFNELMKSQTHALLETTTISLQNALITGQEVDEQLAKRLLNNAVFIKILLEDGKINNLLLKRLAKENEIFRINIFNALGEKIYSSYPETINKDNQQGPIEALYPIFEGLTDTLIIGLREAQQKNEYRYIVGLSTKNDGAIVLVLEADKIFNFRKKLGFGILLKNLTQEPKIIYSVLQDTSGFIAASGKYGTLEDINESEFLTGALTAKDFAWRLFENDTLKVFEAVKPFIINGNLAGLLRIGISLETLQAIKHKLLTRLAISGIILIIIAFVVISFIFANQNINLLKKQYSAVETYSEKILLNVNDAIFVLTKDKIIKSANKRGNILFAETNLIGKPIDELIKDSLLQKLFDENLSSTQITYKKENLRKVFIISKSSFTDENNNINYILVFNDLTEQKILEEKIERQERLAAMGELASGVAHEIRNPLNTIGTITQQLGKDFIPAENKEEYINLTKLVYQEVKRINQTIISFLKFARPEPVNPSAFLLSELVDQIYIQYLSYFKQKEINFNVNQNWDGTVNWDKNKILQALMNLLQNSFDATPQNGSVKVNITNNPNIIEVIVSDTGLGIPEDKLSKIFNLYYTTKAKGTGLGLSITQRIIYQHNGIISVESKQNNGTTFFIKIPINPFEMPS
ncbi:MAG: ATP-binding protein [bacterium]